MRNKFHFNFQVEERNLIIESLNSFRNYLKNQDRTTDSIDNLLIKINDSSKVELNDYDVKITINALNTWRYKLKNENKPRDEVNNVLLKLINVIEKPSHLKEAYER